MGCSCKDSQQEIKEFYEIMSEFRDMFVRRMTVNSETSDRRRKDYNQAIFGYNDDGSTYPCFCETDLEMVMQCFDDAVKDYRDSFCDVKNCKRKR